MTRIDRLYIKDDEFGDGKIVRRVRRLAINKWLIEDMYINANEGEEGGCIRTTLDMYYMIRDMKRIA